MGYILKFDETLHEYLSSTKTYNAGDTLKHIINISPTTTSILMSFYEASGTIFRFYAKYGTVDANNKFRMRLYANSGESFVTGYDYSFDTDYDVEIKENAGNFELWVDGSFIVSGSTNGFVSTILNIGSAASYQYNGLLKSLQIGTETFAFTEGSGSTTTGSEGTVLTLLSDGLVNDMWVSLTAAFNRIGVVMGKALGMPFRKTVNETPAPIETYNVIHGVDNVIHVADNVVHDAI